MHNAPVYPYIFRVSVTGSERFDRYRYRTAMTGGRLATFLGEAAKVKRSRRHLRRGTPGYDALRHRCPRHGVAGRI